VEKTINLSSDQEAISLYGSLDERLRFSETKFKVRVSARNHRLIISGAKQNVQKAVQFFESELEDIRADKSFEREKSSALKPKREISKGGESEVQSEFSFFYKGKIIKARSKNQEAYLKAIQAFDIVISIGPAGTGKTYLAMLSAVNALKRKKVGRLVLTRPAVEAGESLGFLPGDIHAKINPYLRPLYDALYDMMDFDEVSRYLQRGTIEIAPLAYMRGRTLNDSFVILDEGQNCTVEQMKMFLTRLGVSSRAVVTGDITQIDLPAGRRSGLVEAQHILREVKGIHFSLLDEGDVVRHPLVREVIKAYGKHGRK